MKVKTLLLCALLALVGGRAFALTDAVWNQNNRAAGFELDQLHDPTTSKNPATAALRLGDIAVCAGIPWSIGVNGAFRCSGDGSDYLSPATGLLLGGHAGLTLLGRPATGTGAASDIGPGTALQVPQVNAAGTAIAWATLTASGLPGATIYADGIATGTTQLASIGAALLTAGTLAWVASVGDIFALRLSSLSTTATTVIAASGKTGYQWVRLNTQNAANQSVTAWYVDPQAVVHACSDEATGISSSAPLCTMAELARRVNGAIYPVGTTACIVWLESNMNSSDSAYFNITTTGVFASTANSPFGFDMPFTIIGVPTDLGFSGSMSSVQNGTLGSLLDIHFTDSGIPTSFTASGFLVNNVLLKDTTGTVSYFWPVKDLGSKTLRISQPNATASVHPAIANGDSYRVLRLPNLHGIQVAPSLNLLESYVQIAQVADDDPAIQLLANSGIVYVNDAFEHEQFLGGFFSGCQFTDAMFLGPQGAYGHGGFVSSGTFRSLSGSHFVDVDTGDIWQMSDEQSGFITFEAYEILVDVGAQAIRLQAQFFDVTARALLGTLQDSKANLISIGGASNSQPILAVNAATGSITYANAPNSGVTSGTQISLLGTAYAVSALPVADVSSGSYISPEVPSVSVTSAGCAQFSSNGTLTSSGTPCLVSSGLGDPGSNGIVVRTVLNTTIAGQLSGPVTTSGTSLATSLNLGAGGITGSLPLADVTAPTGTGFPHVSSGAWDPAARAVNLSGADVTSQLPLTALAQGGASATNLLAWSGTAWAPTAAGVPTTRTLTMTAPMTCDGGGSCDLSANRTFATPVFAGSAAGLVPASSGGTTTFLRADGTYAVPPGSGGGTITLTGDATGSGTSSIAVTNVNLPNGITQAGLDNITETAAPSTPASGHVDFFADSTFHNGAWKNSSGTLTYGAQVDAGASHHFLTSFAATGAFADAQPAFADISGTASLSQFAAPTGTGLAGVTSGAWDAAATTVSTGLHRTTGVLTADLSVGVSGGQTAIGGTGSGDNFTLSTTSNVTKGKFIFGSTSGVVIDESTGLVGIGVAPTSTLQIQRNTNGANALFLSNSSTGGGAGASLYIGDSNTLGGGDYLAMQLFGTGVATLGTLLGARTAYWSYSGSGGSARLLFQNIHADTTFSVGISPAGGVSALNISQNADIEFGVGLATNATSGFPYLASSAGPPTGASTSYSSGAVMPVDIDRTNARLYVGTPGSSTWKIYGQDTSGLATGPLCNTTTTGVWSACTISSTLSLSGTTLGLPNTGITAGTWVNGNGFFVVDAQGRITGAGVGTNYNAVKVDASTISTSDETLKFVSDFAGASSGGTTSISFLPVLSHYATAEQTYYMEVTPTMIVVINAGSQYIATNSSSALYGSSQIEYPTAGALPSYAKVTACIVGTNTVTSGGLDIFHSVNGSGGIDATIGTSSSGCQTNATTNFGGTVADKFGVGLQADAGLGGGAVTLSGTLHLVIKIREAPVSTF